MDFVKYISTPKDTTEAAPLVTKLKLTRGRLTGGQIYFPSGPAGTLHFLAKIGTHQILPFNTGENFRLDDALMSFTLGIKLGEQPFIIDLVTWNDSTQYAHVCTVSFSLVPFHEDDFDLKSLLDAIASSK
jgi:hypothetical protein